MQPPSLLSSLREITESPVPEAVRLRQPVLEPRPRQTVLPPLLPRDDDGDASDDARSSSSTR
jgi:hypothetical protein